MLTAWRIVKSAYSATAFDGEGAKRYGGRWNSPGTAVVYTAGVESLAVLELLVHLQSSELLLSYVLIEVSFEDRLLEVIDVRALPSGWDCIPGPAALQSIGDIWAAQGRSVVLQIPSALAKTQVSYLLNPFHPDFRHATIGSPMPYRFDSRLR